MQTPSTRHGELGEHLWEQMFLLPALDGGAWRGGLCPEPVEGIGAEQPLVLPQMPPRAGQEDAHPHLGLSGMSSLLSACWSTTIALRPSSAHQERLPSFIFLCNGKCKSEISACEPFSEKTNIFPVLDSLPIRHKIAGFSFSPEGMPLHTKIPGKLQGRRIKGPSLPFRE